MRDPSGEILVDPEGPDAPEVFSGDRIDVGALAEELEGGRGAAAAGGEGEGRIAEAGHDHRGAGTTEDPHTLGGVVVTTEQRESVPIFLVGTIRVGAPLQECFDAYRRGLAVLVAEAVVVAVAESGTRGRAENES